MVFGRYPEGAWEVPGRCLYVSGRCLYHVQYVSGGVWGVLDMSGRCMIVFRCVRKMSTGVW